MSKQSQPKRDDNKENNHKNKCENEGLAEFRKEIVRMQFLLLMLFLENPMNHSVHTFRMTDFWIKIQFSFRFFDREIMGHT